jgi:hypothetical protein
MVRRRLGFAVLLVVCARTPLSAQRVGDDRAGVAVEGRPAAAPADSGGKVWRIAGLRIPRRDSSWWVPLTSAVLPGTGQALIGQDRFVAYLAMEAYLVIRIHDRGLQAIRERDRSQALARDVARANFGGPRPVGPWSYYEDMEKYTESGVFNLTPGGKFVPEGDESTFNGAMWRLARLTYWDDANVAPDTASLAYRNSINYYLSRAVTPEYRWSWRNAQLEQDLFRRAIKRKNQAYSDRATVVGYLAANHILSMLDAFITLRLSTGLGAPGTPAISRLEGTLPWAPFGRPSSR